LSLADPASALDFWLGTWDATWEDGRGTNTVTRDYGGHVRREAFDWRWERSDDDGSTWTQLWAIAYRRRERAA
jgi:hypothetical protein